LIFEPVHSERRRSLPPGLLAKPVDQLFMRSNAISTVALETQWSFFSNNPAFSVCKVFTSSRSSTVRGAICSHAG